MAYQIKFHNKVIRTPMSFGRRGFSLLELLIVIAIFSLFAGLGTSTYYSMRSHSNLELATGSLVEAVRFAQSSAQSGKSDSKWGVEILTNQIVIFKGDTYASRDTTKDEIFNFSSGVSASGLSEIVFEKVTGATVNTGTTTLSSSSESRNIFVNEKGTVVY